jgi:hypothetical protein
MIFKILKNNKINPKFAHRCKGEQYYDRSDSVPQCSKPFFY